MTGKKLTRSERLRRQIEVLQREAAAAAKAERDKRRRLVSRAAARAGLDDLGLGYDALVREFRGIVERAATTADGEASETGNYGV